MKCITYFPWKRDLGTLSVPCSCLTLGSNLTTCAIAVIGMVKNVNIYVSSTPSVNNEFNCKISPILVYIKTSIVISTWPLPMAASWRLIGRGLPAHIAPPDWQQLSNWPLRDVAVISKFKNSLYRKVARALAVKLLSGVVIRHKKKSTLVQVMAWCRQATSHLPEPMLSNKFYDAIWHHWGTLRSNPLRFTSLHRTTWLV